ncbi:hypothetical protein KCG48_10375 [Proteiniclasticum sp. BAD-10]|uniref:Uncharacterized protein n=1 Tax=Proteiniclasticum sediminis TaxID=2804028 RepID=A0A941CR68_9CLOT|nr:hypothetical protein [Proteiniclasticum sediminis]MBR0576737.1 hypothetical protein [Proteiniclasticum sediminis]
MEEITNISNEVFGNGTVTEEQLLATLLENELNHLQNTIYNLLMQRQSHFQVGSKEYKKAWKLMDELAIANDCENPREQIISVIAQL